ncbi:MAG: hypothetical protein J6K77_08305 [Ruminococcus sp.]|nr:hypothetical protein [Ruminococcus sp.]
MKRVISMLLALTAAAVTLTACGEKAENSAQNDESSVSGAEESVTEAELPVQPETEPETEAFEEDPTGITAEECDAVLHRIADAVKSGDKEEVMRNCHSEQTYNALKNFGVLEIFSGGLDSLDGDSEFEVRAVREAEPSVKKAAELQHSMRTYYYGTLAEAGINYELLAGDGEMSREQMQLLSELSPLMNEVNFARSEYTDTVQFDEYVMVTVGGTSGDGVPFESVIGAFRVAGEGVKMDFMTSPANGNDGVSPSELASTVCDAANAALEGLAQGGADVSGVHLLGMNSLMNVGSLNGSYEELFDIMSENAPLDNYIELFIVTVDGKCQYAAGVTNSGAVVTYPEDTKITGISESDHGQVPDIQSVTGVLDYDELYSSAVGAIGG